MNPKNIQFYSATLVFILVTISRINCHQNPLISVCPGEGPRYGDYKCIHDRTHRVCAKLVDDSNTCNELSWNENGASFWDITGQQQWNWKDRICGTPNPGDSWCICMWATANLIKEVGCDNVHINCSATDVNHVMNSYKDGGWNLQEAKSCLQRKCILQNDGRYVNAGTLDQPVSSSKMIETPRSNSLKDSNIEIIPQPSFESGSFKIRATAITFLTTTVYVLNFV